MAKAVAANVRPESFVNLGIGYSILNVSAELRPRELSGSAAPPRIAAEPRPYGSATLGSQALGGALCTTSLAVAGITNKSLSTLMTGLLGGANYSMKQASNDLAPASGQRADHSHPGPQPLPPHRRRPRVRELLHQTARPPAAPMLAADQPHHRYEWPCAPSTFTSHNLSSVPLNVLATKIRYAASGTAPESGCPAGSFGSPGCAHRRGRRLGRWPMISAFATGTC